MDQTHTPLITVTPDDLKRLDSILITLDQQPPEPEHTLLRLFKDAIEDVFIPTFAAQRHEVQS